MMRTIAVAAVMLLMSTASFAGGYMVVAGQTTTASLSAITDKFTGGVVGNERNVIKHENGQPVKVEKYDLDGKFIAMFTKNPDDNTWVIWTYKGS